jgi:hypothetical protein
MKQIFSFLFISPAFGAEPSGGTSTTFGLGILVVGGTLFFLLVRATRRQIAKNESARDRKAREQIIRDQPRS